MAITPAIFATAKEHHDNVIIPDVSVAAEKYSARMFDSDNAPLQLPSAHSEEQATPVDSAVYLGTRSSGRAR